MRKPREWRSRRPGYLGCYVAVRDSIVVMPPRVKWPEIGFMGAISGSVGILLGGAPLDELFSVLGLFVIFGSVGAGVGVVA